MKMNTFITLLFLLTFFWGPKSYGTELNTKTKEALSIQIERSIVKKNPQFKKKLKYKLQKNKKQLLKHFSNNRSKKAIIAAFTVFSQIIIDKEIKFQKSTNKQDIFLNLKEDNFSLNFKLTY